MIHDQKKDQILQPVNLKNLLVGNPARDTAAGIHLIFNVMLQGQLSFRFDSRLKFRGLKEMEHKNWVTRDENIWKPQIRCEDEI